MDIETKAQETKPVLANDGCTILGYCEVKKFRRVIGEPLKEIIILDAEKVIVATILVYRLHSRIHCGEAAVEGQPVDSKRAVLIARAALEHKADLEAMLLAIQDESHRLAPPGKTPHAP